MSKVQNAAGDPAVTLGNAAQGSAAAMVDCARALLIGRDGDQDVKAAVGWLDRAAGNGDPDALELLATVTAVGVTKAPDWPAALDLLQRAAEHGSNRARDQLRLLSHNTHGEVRSWAELRVGIDLAPWMAAAPRTPVNETPRVRLTERFVPPEVCDWLVGRARGRLRAAMMYDGVTKTENVDPHRTCSDYQFDILNTDLVVQLVREKIAAVTGLPPAVMEPPRIFHYALGQDIKAHYDRCNDAVAGYG